jgi:dolichol-phosphate mannosyltransferase/undecaprenyl-phosphate 4-deoxy-4-formamido-L-arabinose transferase
MDRTGEPYEIILVNDDSPDDTWQIVRALTERYMRIKGVDLVFNVGQFRATMCGLEQAHGDFVITMDDDLQHRPEDLPRLIEAMQQNPQLDCVMAKFTQKKHSLLRRLSSYFVHWLYRHLYGKPKHLWPSAFRIMRRDLVDAILAHGTVNPSIGPLIYRSTSRIGNVDLAHDERPGGGSSHSLWSLIRIVWNNFFSASTLALRIVSLLGMICAMASFVTAVCYFTRHVFVKPFQQPGFATIVLLNLFFGGAILFSIGLVGEYLLRIIDEVQRPPRYVVRQIIGAPNQLQTKND